MPTPMREHHHAADEATLNVFRHLRQPWRGWELTNGVVRVQAAGDGMVVRMTVAHAEPERGFRVRRIAAEFERGAVRPVRAVPGFEGGTNDVVILEGESWLTRMVHGEPGAIGSGRAADEALVTHGHPRARPADCDACCATTDAVLVASPRGLMWLVRLGAEADALEVVTDASTIRTFLEARGYRS